MPAEEAGRPRHQDHASAGAPRPAARDAADGRRPASVRASRSRASSSSSTTAPAVGDRDRKLAGAAHRVVEATDRPRRCRGTCPSAGSRPAPSCAPCSRRAACLVDVERGLGEHARQPSDRDGGASSSCSDRCAGSPWCRSSASAFRYGLAPGLKQRVAERAGARSTARISPDWARDHVPRRDVPHEGAQQIERVRREVQPHRERRRRRAALLDVHALVRLDRDELAELARSRPSLARRRITGSNRRL